MKTRILPCTMLLHAVVLSTAPLMGQETGPRLYAHRGGAHEYDENTLHAFQTTYSKGVRGYEIDVRITKDYQLVLFHDADLKRMVGVDGSIEQLTLDEIRQLKTKKGNPIPTLDEALAFFNAKPDLYVEFEMKTTDPAYNEKTLKLYCDELYRKVHASKPTTSTYVMTSFDKKPLRYLKTKYPSVDLMLIKGKGLSQQVLDEAKAMGINRIACYINHSTRGMVKEAQKQGFKVGLWPGRSVSDFLLGVSLGGDYLCTDVPIEIISWTKENPTWIKFN